MTHNYDILTTGEKIYVKSIPCSCPNPFVTSLSLNPCLFSFPSCFMWHTHLFFKTFLPFGHSTNSHILLSCRDLSSSCIALFHLILLFPLDVSWKQEGSPSLVNKIYYKGGCLCEGLCGLINLWIDRFCGNISLNCCWFFCSSCSFYSWPSSFWCNWTIIISSTLFL